MKLLMKRKWQIGFLLGVVTVLALFASRAVAADGKPILVIPTSHHDAGTHMEGERVSHTFEVKNNGSAELKIHRVNPG